ncbi:hypothetical protein EV207_101152 [Scopulibacillus darangshiensis]|uniref:Uncharacterized protein n=1 Tax=Scopulibacillus darangshiensis TaxID=442528 RepID=A0A4R2PCR0_9BACL|nr:hypothetical protein [Scopulibacillus darangshiensis]TCP32174.1 hypothetical protein EV207_101152 [Scopulibacillus darangshiensis]
MSDYVEFGGEPSPLLRIELDKIGSVPRVTYKGEEINNKVCISFDWQTADDKGIRSPYIRIERIETDSNGRPFYKAERINSPDA